MWPSSVSTSQDTILRWIGSLRSGTVTARRCTPALMDLIFILPPFPESREYTASKDAPKLTGTRPIPDNPRSAGAPGAPNFPIKVSIEQVHDEQSRWRCLDYRGISPDARAVARESGLRHGLGALRAAGCGGSQHG